MSIDVTFFKSTPFSLSFTVTSQREDNDLLFYTISSPTVLVPVPIQSPITQVHSRRQNPLVSNPIPATLSSDPIQNDDLPIALRKSKRHCAHPISSFVSYNHLSSSSCSFIASIDSISLPKHCSGGFISPWLA